MTFRYSLAAWEGFLGIVPGNESGVIVEGQITFPSQTVKHGEQAGVLFVNPGANEFDDRDVMIRQASSAEAVAEHKSQGSLQHGFVRLLKASFLIEGENLTRRSELLIRAREEAIYLRPVNDVRFELLHMGL
jgi:hypothetical protein